MMNTANSLDKFSQGGGQRFGVVAGGGCQIKEGLIGSKCKVCQGQVGYKIKVQFNYLSSAYIQAPSLIFLWCFGMWLLVFISIFTKGRWTQISPFGSAENNLVKAAVGKELETNHLNEVWDYMWIIIDGALNKNITQNVHIISGVLELCFLELGRLFKMVCHGHL